MSVYAYDTETHLISEGNLAPKMVCLSYAGPDGEGVLNTAEGLEWFREKIQAGHTLVAHNAPFDIGVILAADFSLAPDVFKALDENRLPCTKVRQQIIDNASGQLKYLKVDGRPVKNILSLQALVQRFFGHYIEKGDKSWRLRYAELEDVPVSEWPQGAFDYALGDSVWALKVFEEQEKNKKLLVGDALQNYAAQCLHFMAVWGLKTDKEHVDELGNNLRAKYETLVEYLKTAGFMRDNGSRNTAAIKEAVTEWYRKHNKEVPRTAGGGVSTSSDTLSATDDPRLLAVTEAIHVQKMLTTYLPVLVQGTKAKINPSYNAILETYRTSCGNPNIQNLPRDGGIRECFVPSAGCFVFCDYDTLELRSLAQVCLDLFGYSKMAEALRDGKDLHLWLASFLAGASYDQIVEEKKAGNPRALGLRQTSKVANFGFPGGMGASRFVEYAAGYGLTLSQEESNELRKTFREAWPEINDYFKYCSGLLTGDAADVVRFVRTGMLRGDVMYTAICNGNFQHLAAIGAKQALVGVTKECYLPGTPLHGCRPIIFLHDEIGIEVPYSGERAHLAAQRLKTVMIESMQQWIPDVPITCEPAMMRRWYKGAEPVYQNGILVPCRPEKDKNGNLSWSPDPI